jgi:hypothetical protein
MDARQSQPSHLAARCITAAVVVCALVIGITAACAGQAPAQPATALPSEQAVAVGQAGQQEVEDLLAGDAAVPALAAESSTQAASDQQDASEDASSDDAEASGDETDAAADASSDAADTATSSEEAAGTAASTATATGSASTAASGASTSGSTSTSGSQASESTATITVTVSIDDSRARAQGKSCNASGGTVTVPQGASVYDALVALGVSVGGNSTYVRSIGGLAEFDCGQGSGWLYQVNGVTPSTSCGAYKLSGGESITWIYTCDLGNDI